MRACQNVWVDGSLRDGAWFTKVFKDVRRRFPRYKIAIFEISASETIVRQRIKSRAAKTGRDVPEELIVGSLASVSKSLDMLTPLCDFVARIGNDDDAPMPPMLRAFIQVDNDGDWGRVEERFAQAESDIAFPRSLAPLRLVPVDVPMATYDKAKHSITLNLDYPALKHIADIVVDSTLRLTPLVSLQRLKSHSRKLANVPVEATSFCFSYPASLNWQALESGADIASDTACLLPLAGGFVYLNQKVRRAGPRYTACVSQRYDVCVSPCAELSAWAWARARRLAWPSCGEGASTAAGSNPLARGLAWPSVTRWSGSRLHLGRTSSQSRVYPSSTRTLRLPAGSCHVRRTRSARSTPCRR